MELRYFIDRMDAHKPAYAIRTGKSEITVFKTKQAFNKSAKMHPDAPQGELNPYNWVWYRM